MILGVPMLKHITVFQRVSFLFSADDIHNTMQKAVSCLSGRCHTAEINNSCIVVLRPR